MKVNTYHYPKSSFLSMEKDMSLISDMLMKNDNLKKMLYPIIIFILIQFLNPFLLGTANQTHTWNTWRNPRNIYQNFNDYNK